jgi:multiple sugar transport system substrate-binding protein
VLRGALSWTAWLGYPGYADPATSEVYNTFLLSTMMAQAARGEKTPEQAVKDTTAQVQQITDKWKRLGYVGCEAASAGQREDQDGGHTRGQGGR